MQDQKPVIHHSFSDLKTVCLENKVEVQLTDKIEEVTCPSCKAGIRKLFATGGN